SARGPCRVNIAAPSPSRAVTIRMNHFRDPLALFGRAPTETHTAIESQECMHPKRRGPPAALLLPAMDLHTPTVHRIARAPPRLGPNAGLKSALPPAAPVPAASSNNSPTPTTPLAVLQSDRRAAKPP